MPRTSHWTKGTTATGRWVEGALVAGVASVACSAIWFSLRRWADDVHSNNPDVAFSGLIDVLLARCVGLASMPVLLWAGMRMLGERRNLLFVSAGTVLWFFVGGRVVEDAVDNPAVVLYLVLFAGLGGLLALAAKAGER